MWFSRCLWSRPRQYIGPLSVRKMIIIILIIIIFVAIIILIIIIFVAIIIIIIIIIIMGMMTIISHFAEYTKLVIIIIICQKEELTLVSAAPPLLLLVVAFTSSKGMSFSFSRSPPTIFSGKFSKPIIGSSNASAFQVLGLKRQNEMLLASITPFLYLLRVSRSRDMKKS